LIVRYHIIYFVLWVCFFPVGSVSIHIHWIPLEIWRTKFYWRCYGLAFRYDTPQGSSFYRDSNAYTHRYRQWVYQSYSTILHRLFSRPVSSSVFGIRMPMINAYMLTRRWQIVYVGLRYQPPTSRCKRRTLKWRCNFGMLHNSISM
jgi:hypothetical protein